LEQDPNDPIANCTLGRILREQDHPAEAIPYLEKAIAANPDYRDALFALAQCRIALNQPQAAIDALRRILVQHPDDAEAHFILGTALSDAGQPAQAAKERGMAGALRAAAQRKAQDASAARRATQP
jgi:predicted Zn-dependent protease